MSLPLEQLPWDKTGRRRERLELEKVPEPVLKKIRHGKAKFPVQEKGAPKIYPSVEHNPDGMVITFSELLSVDVLHVPEVLERMSLAKTGIASMSYDVYQDTRAMHNVTTLIRINSYDTDATTMTNSQCHYSGDEHFKWDDAQKCMVDQLDLASGAHGDRASGVP